MSAVVCLLLLISLMAAAGPIGSLAATFENDFVTLFQESGSASSVGTVNLRYDQHRSAVAYLKGHGYYKKGPKDMVGEAVVRHLDPKTPIECIVLGNQQALRRRDIFRAISRKEVCQYSVTATELVECLYLSHAQYANVYGGIVCTPVSDKPKIPTTSKVIFDERVAHLTINGHDCYLDALA